MSDLPPATGDCYNVVYSVATAFLPVLGAQDIRIVHGIAVGRGAIDGVRFGHAWVECVVNDGDHVVFDMSNGLPPRAIAVDSYYLLGQINADECIKYTVEEWQRMAVEHENYGPWTQAHLDVA